MSSQHLIVAGVDGSEGGRRALEWALREADARGSAVQAVIAWSWDGLEFGPVTATNPTEARERAARLLDEEIKALLARHGSHVPVAAEVIEGSPSDVLGACSRTADLLVLGSHGHGGIRHTVLGSVSDKTIRRAVCPVVVIPMQAGAPAEGSEALQSRR